jgi:anti-sigma B factor antagonist
MMSDPKVAVIRLSGVFDGTKASAFHDDIRGALEDGADFILADCQDVAFMDSSGLGAMIIGLKLIRAVEKRFFICAISKQISMLFDLTDTHRVFQVFADRADFERQVLGSVSS